ncbi:hypothetical protein CGC50_02380 [Capnocytophaga gingivalis]|uniref:Uncharacterized protein n=1 Tax=Capnocytophaga gingivalis TaxID=1017 RepID=A0A250FPV8_9FLAO|nr:hypothetical protein CGC50_02380 [Capnocytophaga gingivalis]
MKKKPTISVGIVISIILLLINFYYIIMEYLPYWDYFDFSSFHTWMIYFYINLIVVPLFIALLFFLFYSFFYRWAKKGLWITSILLVMSIIWFWLYISM